MYEVTLEAELGIIPFGKAEPDYLGNEVKQYTVANLNRITSGTLTLMTPQPTGGYYKTSGVEEFVRKFGYPDMTGKAEREDRLNFGGPFRISSFHERTGLTLVLNGFDTATGKITDTGGGITLISKSGVDAATWHFSEIMLHWNKKHAQAVYIPSNCEKAPELSYRYGNLIRIGYGTDFNLCLKALALNKVYYDPGIKLENASTKPKVKHRSQFRIKSADIESLYHIMKTVDLTG